MKFMPCQTVLPIEEFWFTCCLTLGVLAALNFAVIPHICFVNRVDVAPEMGDGTEASVTAIVRAHLWSDVIPLVLSVTILARLDMRYALGDALLVRRLVAECSPTARLVAVDDFLYAILFVYIGLNFELGGSHFHYCN